MSTDKVGWIARARKPRFSFVDLGVCFAIVTVFVIFLNGWLWGQLKRAFFQSPLPDVRIGQESAVPDSDAYQQAYDFTTDWFSQNIPIWKQVLSPYVGKPDVHYLEVGVFEGRSAIWVLENVLTHPSARLTGIDPFDGAWKEKRFSNLEQSGVSDKANLITGYSQLVMRDLPLNSFDIVYIDGSHAQQHVLEDAVLSWRLLKEGGILIFDDYRWAGSFENTEFDSPNDVPKLAIDPFVQCFREQFEVIHNSYQLILRKRSSQ